MGRAAVQDSHRIGMSLVVACAVLALSVGLYLFTGWGQATPPSLPELHPQSLVLSPASPVDKGVLVLARAKIVNTGGSPAPRFSVEFFYRLKSDPARPWTSFPDGKGIVTLPHGLSPRDQAVTIEGTLDTSKGEIEPGNYEIRVLVDSGNQIPEQDETNNELIVGLKILPSRLGRPDLQPIELIFNPLSPVELGRDVSVTATIRNNGTADSGDFKVQFLSCRLPAPRGACPPDQLTEFTPPVNVAGLKAGEKGKTPGVQFPAPNTPGTYLIQVHVDPASPEQPNGAIEEQDEANNRLTALLTVQGPELYAKSIELPPGLVHAGDEVLVTTTIANSGSGEAAATNVEVAFFIDGRLFATDIIKNLPTGEERAAQGRLKTADLRPGVHELRVVVDPDDKISELDESNNILTTSLTIQPALPKLPELAPKSLKLTPPSPIEQGLGTVTAEIVNNSKDRTAENFDVEFAVREAGRLRWNPITCTVNCRNNKLNPNGELTAQAQLPALTPGSYEVRALIDPQNRVEELDETNNEMVIGFRVITPRKPDLAIIKLAFDPLTLTVQPGQPVRILIEIENIGDAPAPPSMLECAYRHVDEPTPRPFRRVPVPPLEPGQRMTVECRLETGGLRPGFYELSVALDPENRIDEQNETNNFATTGTGVPGEPSPVGQALLIAGPDLVPDQATLKVMRPKAPAPLPPSPVSRITQGEALDVEVVVRNSGAVAAGGFEVAFCVHLLPEPCTEFGTRSRATGLGLADEFRAKAQLLTEVLAPGLYEIGVIVDPPDPSRPYGRVEEINERNNNIPFGGVPGFLVEIVGKPDLRFREPLVFQPAGPVQIGTLLGVFADIENIGKGATTRDFQVEFAFRRTSDPSPDFTVFGTATIAEVWPEKSKQVKAELDTRNLAPGVYEIRVTLDPQNLIPELDKANNRASAAVAIGVSGQVDLAALTIVPNQMTVARGQIVRLSAVIANLGVVASGPFQVEFAYRNLLGWPSGDPVFSRQAVPNLNGGVRITLVADLDTLSLSPGTYEISVAVDPANQVDEIDETNNRLVVFINVN